MAVLITGGAGYIGSHTAKLLAQQGTQPVTVDNLSTGRRTAVRWGPLIESDIADENVLSEVCRRHAVKAVIHLAATCYTAESIAHPSEYFRNNISKTLALLDTMLRAGVKNLVFASTCAVYGAAENIPIREDAPAIPVNPYGESKLIVERALKWYQSAYGLNWIALRYFNVAGADPGGELGEQHDPETHLVPQAVLAALGQRGSVNIYGTDYPTPDGSAIRDYVHVSDVAAANLRALHYVRSGGTGCALNIGSGQGHSVLEVMRAVETSVGRAAPTQTSGRRDGDPPVVLAEIRRAAKLLEWTPNQSSLEHIIATAHRWHGSRLLAAPVG